MNRQRAIEKELACLFVKIIPNKEDFNIFKTINEIHRHIKKKLKNL